MGNNLCVHQKDDESVFEDGAFKCSPKVPFNGTVT